MGLFGAFVAVMAGIASAAGVLARGDGAYINVVSPRGIAYEMATTGVYAFNAKPLVAEGAGWDLFTLAVVVPATLISMAFVARGSYRGTLIGIGLFGYYVYMYLEYAVTWAFGPLFPLFVTICGLSLIGIVWFSNVVVRDGVEGRFTSFPVRTFVVLNVSLATLLTVMWSGRIATALSGDLVTAGLFGETTLVVQALDLGLVVPIAVLAAISVWRRTSAGYAVGAVWSVVSAAMAAALVAMLISSGMVTGEVPWPPIVIFGLFIAGYSWVAVRVFGSINEPDTAPGNGRQRGRHETKWASRPTSA